MHALPRPFRAFLLALVLATGAVFASSAQAASPDAASPDGAATFIRELGHRAINDLGDESVPIDKRVDRFRELVDKGFAMDAISRFVLGRYARVANDSQMADFRKVFLQVIAQRFLPLFEGYSEEDFRVDGAQSDPRSDNLYLVNSRVRSPSNDKFAKAGWRVRHKDGEYEIVDVIAEGVSMAITLRSEYSSVIQQNGGRVEALIAKLKEKVAEGEIKSTAMSESDG